MAYWSARPSATYTQSQRAAAAKTMRRVRYGAEAALFVVPSGWVVKGGRWAWRYGQGKRLKKSGYWYKKNPRNAMRWSRTSKYNKWRGRKFSLPFKTQQFTVAAGGPALRRRLSGASRSGVGVGSVSAAKPKRAKRSSSNKRKDGCPDGYYYSHKHRACLKSKFRQRR